VKRRGIDTFRNKCKQSRLRCAHISMNISDDEKIFFIWEHGTPVSLCDCVFISLSKEVEPF
jgi:hypothetical protein